MTSKAADLLTDRIAIEQARRPKDNDLIELLYLTRRELRRSRTVIRVYEKRLGVEKSQRILAQERNPEGA